MSETILKYRSLLVYLVLIFYLGNSFQQVGLDIGHRISHAFLTSTKVSGENHPHPHQLTPFKRKTYFEYGESHPWLSYFSALFNDTPNQDQKKDLTSLDKKKKPQIAPQVMAWMYPSRTRFINTRPIPLLSKYSPEVGSPPPRMYFNIH